MFRWLSAALAVCVWLGAGVSAQAAGQVRMAAAPSWVEDLPIPKPRADRMRQVSDGIYYLLDDHQDRPAAEEVVAYARSAYQITDRTGLESGASLDLGFDPLTEDLTLHHIRVWRNGVATDRLAGADIQVLRREKNLDDGIINGRRTAHIVLKDIRVGDIVDYGCSWDARDRVLNGAYFGSNDLGWSVPMGVARYRLLWPRGWALNSRRYAGAPAPRVTHLADFDEYVWRVVDPAPVHGEDNTPEWKEQWAHVVASSMRSWADVVRWAVPLYRQSEALPPAFAHQVDLIAATYADPRDRVTAALRLVQDNVRYVSLSIASDGYVPHAPADVVRSGYGDCKDKALLLVTVLHRLGIQASPALTDTDRGPGLPDAAPSTSAFNHVIVRIDLAGRAYWVDPTRSHAGGRFPALHPIQYRWALPIRPGQTKLESIPAPASGLPVSDVTERYDVPRQAGDLTLTVVSIYRDGDADWMRADLASRSPADYEKKYLEYYQGLYPGLTRTAALTVTDNRDANVLSVGESYSLPSGALRRGKLAEAFPINASTLDSYKAPAVGVRHQPLLLPSPVTRRHRIVLVTPGHKPPAPSGTKIDGVAFRYDLQTHRKGGILTIDETLVGKTAVLEAADVAAFREDTSRLSNAIYADLDLTSWRGGSIGSTRVILLVALVALGGLLIAGGALGLRAGLRADASYAGTAHYYPVTLRKFLVMNIATAGMYGFFWRWKCWRWARKYDRQAIAPFWRTLFSVLWLYPLFRQINERLGRRALPTWIGASAAVGYLAWSIANSAVTRWDDAPAGLSLIAGLSFVCTLPSAVAVKRLNAPEIGAAQAMAENSRYTGLSLIAIAVGIVDWVALLSTAFS
ncbi:DUF3857 domain-containing transglutaminase family protein [Phenylobacterium hankyongense]|nr:DUF3857 domain-containing transglutaminase family protein [Phenylobacterium hankyongense]